MQNNNYTRVNFQIRVDSVRVLGDNNENYGVMSTRDAIRMANGYGLDLVEINPQNSPPVCRIMDYGKFKYEEKKRLQASKRNQQVQELKELIFRPNTCENDLQHKLKQAREFLQEGNRVKFTVKFRGREITHPEIGEDRLYWVMEQLSELIMPNPTLSLDGKNMFMTVYPKK